MRAAPAGRSTHGGLALLHEIEDDVRELDAGSSAAAMFTTMRGELERRGVVVGPPRTARAWSMPRCSKWRRGKNHPRFWNDKKFEEETVQMIKDATDEQVKYVDAIRDRHSLCGCARYPTG